MSQTNVFARNEVIDPTDHRRVVIFDGVEPAQLRISTLANELLAQRLHQLGEVAGVHVHGVIDARVESVDVDERVHSSSPEIERRRNGIQAAHSNGMTARGWRAP